MAQVKITSANSKASKLSVKLSKVISKFIKEYRYTENINILIGGTNG